MSVSAAGSQALSSPGVFHQKGAQGAGEMAQSGERLEHRREDLDAGP